MQVRYKVNGKEVSAEEFRAHNDDPARLAEMLESQTPPGTKGSDRAFLEGRCNGNQFEGNPSLGDYYRGVAAAHGQDAKGKVYLSGLAAFPGDPRAWVSDVGEAKRVVEERGWGCDGAAGVKLQKVAEPTGGGVAPDIVEAQVREEIEASPESVKDVEAVRERVTNQLKPHWAP